MAPELRRLTEEERHDDEETSEAIRKIVDAAITIGAERAAKLSQAVPRTPRPSETLTAQERAANACGLGVSRHVTGLQQPLKKLGRGRPPNCAVPWNSDPYGKAKRAAVYWVRLKQLEWCREHGRECRVPREVTERLVGEAIEIAEKAFAAFQVRLRHAEIGTAVDKNDRATVAER
jgi:hypothetical protein